MTAQHRRAPSPLTVHRHRLIVRGLLVALVAGLGVGSWWLMVVAGTHSTPAAQGPTPTAQKKSVSPTATTPPRPRPTTASSAPLTLTASGPGRLAKGSDPSVLPGPILIADESNDRLLIIDPRGRAMWKFPRPGDLDAGQSFKAPDDAFFTPNGRQVITTEEDDDVIRVIDVATHKIVYTYGIPGVPGSGPNQLSSPDDGLMLPSGDIVVPDIKNCRIVMIPKGGHAISRQLGRTGTCVHDPPQTFGSPNGILPMSNGNYLVTEAKGNWVDEMDLSGRVAWSVPLPGVTYIYESNEIGPNRYLTVDHASPGQVLTFDRSGHVPWRYAPTGSQALDMPSLALPLPNGDFMVDDKANHRIIIVDPRTNFIVWQYGHTNVAGSYPGYMNNPTGLDLYPPNSLLVKNAATMGAETP